MVVVLGAVGLIKVVSDGVEREVCVRMQAGFGRGRYAKRTGCFPSII